RGVERWLTQRLSHVLGADDHGNGVCAGVDFVRPASLIGLLTDTDDADPWDPERLVWRVLSVIDASMDDAWCDPLARHLGKGRGGEEYELRQERRWSVARRIAGLFATYARDRPRMLEEWDLDGGGDGDGAGGRVDADLGWQPELWRRVAATVDGPTPVRRHRNTVAAITAGAPLALPDRLSLFGYTRLAVTELELIAAVAEVREVHLWLPVPSPATWDALSAVVADGPVKRRQDPAVEAVRHPLSAALGRDVREMQRALSLLPSATAPQQNPSYEQPHNTLLGWLQHDIRADTVPDRETRTNRHLTPADTSVQVHATHGIPRQVEVLRDVLTGLLQDDPTLEPRDIVVMCPDVDAYAPAITGAFGLGSVIEGGHPGHRLRVQLADRAPRATNPVLAVAADLVGIAAGRATLSDVLALAASAPVCYRFAFTDDDLATAESWARQAGVRWGLTGPLRRAYKLEQFDQNTWETGLDRLMAGVAMAEHDLLVGEVLPLDDVSSADIDLAGRLAELVARIRACVEHLQDSGPVRERLAVLRDAVSSLSDTAPSEAWQLAQFERAMARVVAGVEAHAGPKTQVRLRDLRGMLDVESGARPTRANFRTGNLTVCTMVPMRSVPHRVVCLLGLEDGSFPRTQTVDGDDVLARDPVTGELDLRSQDRQLLLDAVMAATDKLVLLYTAANPGTGQERPPSVPLGELMDTLNATSAASVIDHILVRHPLQPNDVRNVTPGELVTGRPFSFDPAALSGARAAAHPTPGSKPFLDAPLSAKEGSTVVGLAELQAFLANPARAFLRQRLDVAAPGDADEADENMPVDPNALRQWAVGDRVLRRLLSGASPESVFYGEVRRGDLPPGILGERILSQVGGRAARIVQATEDVRAAPAEAVSVDVALSDGRRLAGTVPDVRDAQIVRVGYSSVQPRGRLLTWVDLVCLAANDPSQAWTAITVGRQGTGVRAARYDLLDGDALTLLEDLVSVYDTGMREPLPVPVKTSSTWAEAVHRGKAPDRSARTAWEGKDFADTFAENRDAAFSAVFGQHSSWQRISGTPGMGEDPTRQRSRLGAYAVRIWDPLLQRERLGAL
ncbi:exodeoxyribonuclease V subunit gamma, partial [Lapillicoccus sp.]|uniref:exodeoxyribonuclease V subunit gamma n=1 Tax=Lapillicoccus sp. TaxID=1909287 RepID=UPI0032668FCF